MNNKTIIKQNNKIRFSLRTCVFILWSIFLIIIATFTQITLTEIGIPTFILKHFMISTKLNLIKNISINLSYIIILSIFVCNRTKKILKSAI